MNYGGVSSNKSNIETWESLLVTANNDFVSVLILWYTEVGLGGTYAWMLPHTLEKYLKSFLLKSGHVTNNNLRKFGKNGHGLKEIWEKYKSITTTTTRKPKLNEAFDKIIEDLSTIDTGLRYSGFVTYSSDSLLYFYIILCSFLRYLIIGKDAYRSSFYGLNNIPFSPMNYDPMSQSYAEMIVQKMLHLSLEHGLAFTNMGSINSMDFNELSMSNTAKMEMLSECPMCKDTDCSHLKLIQFYRNIKPTILKS